MDRVDPAQLAATAARLQHIIDDDLRQQTPIAQPLRALNVMQLGEHQFPERVQLLGPLIHAGDLAMVLDVYKRQYQRSDLFEKRRNLMADWAKFLGTAPAVGDNIVQMHKVAA